MQLSEINNGGLQEAMKSIKAYLVKNIYPEKMASATIQLLHRKSRVTLARQPGSYMKILN
ncbi:MAG: hypothetical protein RR581_06945 [Eubacterium sp.]